MAGQGKEPYFEKILTEADVKGDLEIPKGKHRLIPEGTVMHVRDEDDTIWVFRSPPEKRGKRYLEKHWRNFVSAKSAKAGDTVKFYHANQNSDYIQLDRRGSPDSRGRIFISAVALRGH